jgi:hypothetical protein
MPKRFDPHTGKEIAAAPPMTKIIDEPERRSAADEHLDEPLLSAVASDSSEHAFAITGDFKALDMPDLENPDLETTKEIRFIEYMCCCFPNVLWVFQVHQQRVSVERKNICFVYKYLMQCCFPDLYAMPDHASAWLRKVTGFRLGVACTTEPIARKCPCSQPVLLCLTPCIYILVYPVIILLVVFVPALGIIINLLCWAAAACVCYYLIKFGMRPAIFISGVPSSGNPFQPVIDFVSAIVTCGSGVRAGMQMQMPMNSMDEAKEMLSILIARKDAADKNVRNEEGVAVRL